MSEGYDAPERNAVSEELLAAEGAAEKQASGARPDAASASETPVLAEQAAPVEEAALAEEPALAETPDPAEIKAAITESVAIQEPSIAPVGNCGDLPHVGKTQLGAATSVAASFQAIIVEATEYSKKTLDNRLAFYDRLRGAKSLESAIEIQSEYAKASYAEFVAETAKMRGLCSGLAKAAFRPVQTAFILGQDAKP